MAPDTTWPSKYHGHLECSNSTLRGGKYEKFLGNATDIDNTRKRQKYPVAVNTAITPVRIEIFKNMNFSTTIVPPEINSKNPLNLFSLGIRVINVLFLRETSKAEPVWSTNACVPADPPHPHAWRSVQSVYSQHPTSTDHTVNIYKQPKCTTQQRNYSHLQPPDSQTR